MGIPTAPIVTRVFEPVVKMYARLVGMPHHRIVYVPQPISRVPAALCREYIEGNDPITGKPVIDEIVDALTRPLTEGDKNTGLEDRQAGMRLEPDSEDNLHRFFMENGMTDYLPIILPTEERVAEMLRGTSHMPDEVIGEIRSGYEGWSMTVKQVAANAVMAGARPEYLPVILAMAASGVAGISTSTQSFTATLVVNGPIRKEIGMNSGCGAMSPFNQANATIGRAFTLIALNGGGGKPGKTYWGSQGNTIDYNHCALAENEEELPAGWLPFHVQKGFKPEESVISFFRAWGIWNWKNTFKYEKHKAILQLSNWVMANTGLTLILDPIVADHLVGEGFPTKEAVSEYITQNSQLTLEDFWGYHQSENSRRAATRGVEPWASWLNQPQDTLMKRFRKPDAISILVAGGRTNDFWQAGDWQAMGSYSIDEWR